MRGAFVEVLAGLVEQAGKFWHVKHLLTIFVRNQRQMVTGDMEP